MVLTIKYKLGTHPYAARLLKDEAFAEMVQTALDTVVKLRTEQYKEAKPKRSLTIPRYGRR